MKKESLVLNLKRIMFLLVLAIFVIHNFYSYISRITCSNRLKCYLILILVLILLVFTIQVFGRTRIKMHIMAFILVLMWGMIVGMVCPPGTAPDERAHITSAYEHANVLLGKSEYKQTYAETKKKLVKMRANDYEDNPEQTIFTNLAEYERIVNGEIIDRSEEYIDYYSPDWIYPWYKYIPATIGVTLTRTLGLGKYVMLYFGRFLNLLVFALSVAFSVRIIPRGKIEMMAFSMIPFMLGQANSFSYDAISNSLAIIFVSLFLYYMENINKLSIRRFILIAFVYLYLMQFKGIYIGYVLLIICLLYKKKKSFKNSTYISLGTRRISGHFLNVLLLLVGVILVISVILYILNHSDSFFSANLIEIDQRGPIETYSLQSFFTDTEYMLFTVFPQGLQSVLSRMLYENNQFAWVGSNWLYIIGITACNVVLMTREKGKRYDKSVRVILVAVIISVCLLCYFGALFSWTPQGDVGVWGMQPRYFLPAIMTFMVAYGSDEEVTMNQYKWLYVDQIFLMSNIFYALNITLFR